MSLLLALGANPDAQDELGNTPLHFCLERFNYNREDYNDYKKMIKELLFNGANKELTDNDGNTPIDYLHSIRERIDEA